MASLVVDKVNRHGILPFRGNDYPDWSFRMQLLFQQENLWTIVDQETSQIGRLAGGWATDDIKARRILVECIDNEMLEYIKSKETANEMWTCLKDIYSGTSLAKLCNAFGQLVTMRYNGTDDLQAYFRKFDVIVRSYKDAGGTLAERELIVILFHSLPDVFSVVITALTTTLTEANFTSDKVRRALLEDDARRKNRDVAQTCSDPSTASAFKVDSGNKSSNTNVRCFNCGERGHKSPQCTIPSKKSLPKKSGHRNGNFKGKHAFMVHGSDEKPVCDDVIDFVCDCGSSEHIVGDLSILSGVKKFPPFSIGLAKDGHSLSVDRGGTLNVQSFVHGGKPVEITLNETCYSRDVRENLLSIGKLDDGGARITIENGEMTVAHAGETIFVAKKVGGIYWASFEVLKPTANLALAVKESNELWHRRFGHISMRSILTMNKQGAVKGLDNKVTDDLDFCSCCVRSKKTRDPFNHTRPKTDRLLERVHTDVCGPFPVETYDGYRYYVAFTDDYSHLSVTYLIRNKSEVFEKFKEYLEMAEAHCNTRLSRLRCDNGGEYTSNEFKSFCKSRGIVIEYVPAYNPELNGVSERLNRTLQDKMRSMLLDSGMSNEFWGDAIMVATYLTNRSATEVLNGKTPFEKWYRRKPDVSHLRVFGSKAYTHVPKQKRESKVSERSKECVMIGYTHGGYRLFDVNTRTVVDGRSVRFNESKSSEVYVIDNTEIPAVDESEISEASKSDNVLVETPVKTIKDLTKLTPVRKSVATPVKSIEEKQFEDVIQTPVNPIPFRFPTRNRKPPRWQLTGEFDMQSHLALLAGSLPSEVPSNFADVVGRDDEAEWRVAIDNEIQSLEKNKTWKIVPTPKSVKVINSRWIFKRKADTNGDMNVYKARLVAKGFMQKHGFDYFDTYAPVARLPTIRLLLSVGIKYNLLMDHLDVKTAFLNGDLHEDVYMKPPEGFVVPSDHVLKLQKSLYGLKQSPRCWNEKFHECMTKFGFVRSQADPCLYVNVMGESFIFLVLYVDDMLLISNNHKRLSELKTALTHEFEMKDLGQVANFMGLRIRIDRDRQELYIDQSKYALSILEKFGMDQCHPKFIPMEPKLQLERSENSDSDAPYRELLGSLMYLMLGTRPDLCFAISKLSRYQDCYDEVHFTHLKAVLRYLKGTVNDCLTYTATSNDVLIGYVDSDWAFDQLDRKSTTGFLLKVFGNTVLWCSKKQGLIAGSSTEAEYIAAYSSIQEALWIEKVLNDLKITVEHPITIYEDNMGCIQMSKNSETKRTKHMEVKYYFLRDMVQEGHFELKYVSSNNQIADYLTKALSRVPFEYCKLQTGLKCGGVLTDLL